MNKKLIIVALFSLALSSEQSFASQDTSTNSSIVSTISKFIVQHPKAFLAATTVATAAVYQKLTGKYLWHTGICIQEIPMQDYCLRNLNKKALNINDEKFTLTAINTWFTNFLGITKYEYQPIISSKSEFNMGGGGSTLRFKYASPNYEGKNITKHEFYENTSDPETSVRFCSYKPDFAHPIISRSELHKQDLGYHDTDTNPRTHQVGMESRSKQPGKSPIYTGYMVDPKPWLAGVTVSGLALLAAKKSQ